MNNIEKSRELQYCSYIKAYLMLCVVLYHCCVFWAGNWFTGNPVMQAPLLAFFSKWLNSFHIYGFFLVSGYLFYYSVCEEKHYNTLILFLGSKFKRLIVPYIFVSVIWVVPFARLFQEINYNSIIKKYVFAMAPNQLWFLIVLFWISVLFYILRKQIVKFQKLTLCLTVLVYFVGVFFEGRGYNYFQFFTLLRCSPFFFIGCMIRKEEMKFLYRIPSIIYFIANAFLFNCVCCLEKCSFPFSGYVLQIMELFLRVEGAVGAFFVLQKLFNNKGKISVLDEIFSKYGMPIYLFHQQLIYICISVLNGKVSPFINVLINFSAAFSISLVISMFVTSNRITCFLIGEKYSIQKSRRGNQ